MGQEKLKDFKRELRELLIKHDAAITVGYGAGTDTHGIYDPHMCVEFGNRGGFKLHDDWCTDASELKED